MAQTDVAEQTGLSAQSEFAATDRRDRWWVGPLLTALGLGAFVVYSTARAVAGIWTQTYHLGHGAANGILPDHAYLLSPFYSPLFTLPESLAWISPAFLILWAPGGFRVTCYYYRKAYYRAIFLDPVGCAVGEPGKFCGVARGKDSKGETRLLLFQNLHRYFLYLALMFLVLLSWDFIESCLWPVGGGGLQFGVSIGSLVLLLNVVLLGLYTFSCHSLRHLVGGRVDCFSKAAFGQTRFQLWKCTSALNKKHMLFAWLSLFWVGFSDFYVWMVASGRITDLRIL